MHCLGGQGAERRKVLRGERRGAAGAKGSGRKEDTGNEKTIGKNDERGEEEDGAAIGAKECGFGDG